MYVYHENFRMWEVMIQSKQTYEQAICILDIYPRVGT